MNYLHVAVGVIKNSAGQILISLRDEKLHQGGLWEFPGGKVEADESVEQALARELKEELDINIESAVPLISIKHMYPDLAVQLHVYRVNSFAGEAKGCEGQAIKWVYPDELTQYRFPDANVPIISAVRLPAYYAILDDADKDSLSVNLDKFLNQGIRLIQARLKRLPSEELALFLNQAQRICRQNGAILLLNSSIPSWERYAPDGIHLTSGDLMRIEKRPQGMQWVAASCHNLAELKHAEKIGVDFVVLAPVLPTPTHPNADTLGWRRFSEWVNQVNLPVYALGGMEKSNLMDAKCAGAQGIAAIRAFSR